MVDYLPAKAERRTFAAFWIFGVLNNVLYVVILSAAVDLVGALVPKATVLLADVLPAFLIKIVAPFFIHLIPYKARIYIMVGLDVSGMLIVAFSTGIAWKLFSIALVSLSSGGGELTFLQLTHYFSDQSLKGFSSGTGGAGLLGSFFYMLLTTWLGLGVKSTLLIFSIVPFTFFYTFFVLLPEPMKAFGPITTRSAIPLDEEQQRFLDSETLTESGSSSSPSSRKSGIQLDKNTLDALKMHIGKTLLKLQPLVIPYMMPLLTVYVAEYMINQGVSPTLLFPLDETPFHKYRDSYVTYGALYQLGVFISRSSSSVVRIKKLYIPSLLQLLNLVICVMQSLYMFIPSIYLVMILVFYEGLLGGASYVNTFMLVSETTTIDNREFAMGAVGMSDSAGIVLAASISMWLEPRLCQFQVDSGRPWCRME